MNEWGSDMEMLFRPEFPRPDFNANGLSRIISDALFTPLPHLQVDPHAVMALDGSPDTGNARVMVKYKKGIVVVTFLDSLTSQHAADVLHRFENSLSRHYLVVRNLSYTGQNHYFLVRSQ